MEILVAFGSGILVIVSALIKAGFVLTAIIFAVGSCVLIAERSKERYREREAADVVTAKPNECAMCFERIIVGRRYCSECVAARADVRWMLHQGQDETP